MNTKQKILIFGSIGVAVLVIGIITTVVIIKKKEG